MMNYKVNAWLDKRQPELQLIEQDSGDVVGCWRGRGLQELFNSGLITYQELASNSQHHLKRLIKTLILELTCEELCGRYLYQR